MEPIIHFVSSFFFLPAVLASVYCIFIFKSLPYELKPLAWFVILSGVIEISAKILGLFETNNLPLLHIYVAGGFVCLALFYGRVFKGLINDSVIYGILSFFLMGCLVNVIFFQPLLTFNSHLLTVEAVLIIIFSLSTYMLLLNEIVKKSRMELLKSLNWVNSGLFIYYTSSLIIFFFGDMISQTYSLQTKITWSLHAVFSCLMYVCFFIGLWNRPRI